MKGKKGASKPESPKKKQKETFLDYEKELKLDNESEILKYLDDSQKSQWHELKEEDDEEDFDSAKLKTTEKKFTLCHSDIEKKRQRYHGKHFEKALISFETIAKNHPALKFLDHELVVNLMLKRDIKIYHPKLKNKP